jgi:hypothetical protein
MQRHIVAQFHYAAIECAGASRCGHENVPERTITHWYPCLRRFTAAITLTPCAAPRQPTNDDACSASTPNLRHVRANVKQIAHERKQVRRFSVRHCEPFGPSASCGVAPLCTIFSPSPCLPLSHSSQRTACQAMSYVPRRWPKIFVEVAP